MVVKNGQQVQWERSVSVNFVLLTCIADSSLEILTCQKT